MTVLARHKVKGSTDREGRWGINRIVNGEPVFEIYPDFHSAKRRLGQIAREKRRSFARHHRRGQLR